MQSGPPSAGAHIGPDRCLAGGYELAACALLPVRASARQIAGDAPLAADRHDGLRRAAPTRPLNFLAGVSAVPFRGDWTNALHIFAGFAGVLGLLILRAQFNIGIHPIGFLSASVYAMNMMWFSIFIGWVFKSLISRYGGMKGYLGFMPLFLGLILGDVVNAVIWICLGYVTQVGYQIMPG